MSSSSATAQPCSEPSLRRVDFPRAGIWTEANIRRRYPAEVASWIWHPERLNETAFLRFTLEFELESEEAVTLQVSADQRFQLSMDGIEFAFGPDRSDLGHWSLQTYEGRLQPGRHTLSALVWWIADIAYGVPQASLATHLPGRCATVPTPPMAQCSFRGGFLVAALGAIGRRINTGIAPWGAEDLTRAVHLEKRDLRNYHDIGPSFVIDAKQWNCAGPVTKPVVIRSPVVDTTTGVALAGWKLEPTPLPEQQREIFEGGKIREAGGSGEAVKAWQHLVSGLGPIRIAPKQSVAVLWDLEDYRCGYPLLKVSGGEGATIGIEWAEALYEAKSSSEAGGNTPKGHRNNTEGKVFFGFGDCFICSGGHSFAFPSFWWRSGRFIEIRVTTGTDALVIEKLALKTTRYPLECESHFRTDDPVLEDIARLAINTMKVGTHELLTDSPYYEQMAYVGDNVTESLVSYSMSCDTRIAQRAIELFDWSRSATGLVAERWPCALYQGSATYAMLWPSMVRNHAWWRNEPEFIHDRLPGVRHLIEELAQYRRSDGLFNRLPGWSFVDWVPEWVGGYPPAHEEGDSSLINMHWVHCLQAAADLELHFGEPELHQRLKRMEEEAKMAIIARYRCPESGLFYDDGEHHHLSEHANALASILGLRQHDERDWPAQLQSRNPARCSIYFTHYLMDALYRENRSDPFFARLDCWRSFLDHGLYTLPEQPEPTRSDCHAWGSHPLYHSYASIAGIRPSSPGFRTVHIRPMLGPLKYMEGSLPHPEGEIRFSFQIKDSKFAGFIVLPPSIRGILEIGYHIQTLASGENTFSMSV